jgi:hypothetical protein
VSGEARVKYKSGGEGDPLTSSAFCREFSDLERGVVGRGGLEAMRGGRSALMPWTGAEKATNVTSEC